MMEDANASDLLGQGTWLPIAHTQCSVRTTSTSPSKLLRSNGLPPPLPIVTPRHGHVPLLLRIGNRYPDAVPLEQAVEPRSGQSECAAGAPLVATALPQHLLQMRALHGSKSPVRAR